MAWDHLVRQIIRLEEQEIDLYQRIAQGAPSRALRDQVMRMVEHERRELNYWNNLLQGSHMPGYWEGDTYAPEGKKEQE